MIKRTPTSLDVLGRPVTVQVVAQEVVPGAYGRWLADDRLVQLSASQDQFDLRDTMLHEVMHAIRSHQGREYGGKVEEDYVRSLATGLTHVFRDNPEFAKWLISHPKTK